jgi:hypothetical protein
MRGHRVSGERSLGCILQSHADYPSHHLHLRSCICEVCGKTEIETETAILCCCESSPNREGWNYRASDDKLTCPECLNYSGN